MTRHTERRDVAMLRARIRLGVAVRDLVRSGTDTTANLKTVAMRFRKDLQYIKQLRAAIVTKEARDAMAANDTPAANDDSYGGKS